MPADRSRFLALNTTSYIGAYLGTKQYHSRVLTKLIKGGYLYHHPESTHHRDARYRDMLWSLTEAGDRLYEQFENEPHRNFCGPFAHACGVSLIGASIDLGTRAHGLSLTYRQHKPIRCYGLQPDEPPFLLSSASASIDFVGFEFDRNTESITGTAKDTVERKLQKYAHFLRSGAFRAVGLSTCFVPIITINRTHMEGLLTMVERTIHPKLHGRFLFKTTVDFKDFDRFPTAPEHIITEPWQRIGGSFSILDALEASWTSTSSKSSSGNERLSIS